MTGSNPTDRGKLGTKRHILTDKKGIPLSVVISSASTHDIKLVTDVMDNAVVKRHISSPKTKTGRKRKLQHLCLDKAYNSKPEEQAISKRGYVPHLPHKRKRGEVKKDTEKNHQIAKNILQEDGLWREPTHGTTGSGNCSQDMKRRWRTILGWCSSHAVSLFTER